MIIVMVVLAALVVGFEVGWMVCRRFYAPVLSWETQLARRRRQGKVIRRDVEQWRGDVA
jgi:Protein of unknown function (DUF1049).